MQQRSRTLVVVAAIAAALVATASSLMLAWSEDWDLAAATPGIAGVVTALLTFAAALAAYLTAVDAKIAARQSARTAERAEEALARHHRPVADTFWSGTEGDAFPGREPVMLSVRFHAGHGVVDKADVEWVTTSGQRHGPVALLRRADGERTWTGTALLDGVTINRDDTGMTAWLDGLAEFRVEVIESTMQRRWSARAVETRHEWLATEREPLRLGTFELER